MPICCMCHQDKPPEAFAFRSLATGELQDHCRECHADYRRQHYVDNKPTYIENERLRVRRHRERNRELLLTYLFDHPCVDCGEADPVVLDFDHRDPLLKRLEVTKLAAKKPWPIVLEEIAKCDVRCANCHRKRTAAQFLWRRARELPVVADPTPDAMPAEARYDLFEQPPLGTRQCRTCHLAQPLGEFALKNKKTGQRSWKCKACQREYARQHYVSNRPAYIAKSRRRNATEREKFALFLITYLQAHPCIDCGGTDLRILDFDHRERGTKVDVIGAFVRRWDWEGLQTEIAKCDVRCANCHRRRTAQQLGYYRARVPEGGAAA